MPTLDLDQQELFEASPPNYLFVDDDIPILTLFKNFFSHKASVVVATDGKDALNKIAAQSFDAIISDVDMPLLNGIGLFRSLYAKDPSITKRFLFCTGNPSSELTDFCSGYGIRCICKPVSLAALQEELLQLCNELPPIEIK